MADVIMARRRSALAGVSLPVKDGVAAVADDGPVSRFIYRGAPEAIAAAFGVAPSTVPMKAAANGDRAALWLGPDEWLLLAPVTDGVALRDTLSASLIDQPASLVDVGHRQLGLAVKGPRAAGLINAGCPLDLDLAAFPVGMCTRTILAKADVVLWRTAEDAFHIEVWRSFAPYVIEFLREALFGVD